MNGKTAKLLRKSHQISPYSFRSIKAWWLSHPAYLRGSLRKALIMDLKMFRKSGALPTAMPADTNPSSGDRLITPTLPKPKPKSKGV